MSGTQSVGFEEGGKTKKTEKILYWAPRILSILFICFLALFSIDVFEQGKGTGEILIGLFVHNIPAIIMIVILVIAWRKEIVGAICYLGVGFLYIGLVTFNVINSELPWYVIKGSMAVAGPAFIIGILFLINWKKRTKCINPICRWFPFLLSTASISKK